MAYKFIERMALVLLACLLCMPGYALAVQPEREGQENFLIRGAYNEGRLWLLSDAGQLFSLSETDKVARREVTPDPVIDMCVMDGQLTILTASADTPGAWKLSHSQTGKWVDRAHVPIEKSGLVGMTCPGHSVVLLTHKHLLTIKAAEVHDLQLQDDIGYGIATLLATEDSVYVGLNIGEWGGGLHVIDRLNGAVTHVNSNESGEICGGPLNAKCDPVNGLAIIPWKPDCQAVAIGLIHMMAHGRITMICKESTKALYTKQFGERFPNKNLPPEKAYQTLPFYGLMAQGNALLAVGYDGLYRLTADGNAAYTPLPEFKSVGPFRVSFAEPGIILVKTVVNGRFAMSGPVPMLIPR